jgi:hypothetical protein
MDIREQNEHAVAVRELLREAKILAARYYALTEKPLGVTGEVAALNLVLAPARQPDYDAFQNNNGKVERYQIKGRAIAPTDRYRGRVPSIECNRDFEWVLLVLLDRSSYSALEIWQATRESVRERLEAPGSKARNERNSMGITQFLSIARRVWPLHKPAHSPKGPINGERPNTKMTRGEAIHHGNRHCKSAGMHGRNTRFANVNASKDVWWLDIPEKTIVDPSFDMWNLLLFYETANQQRFHHLMIPIAYLAENIRGLRPRDDMVHLELSVEARNLFQDVVGSGRVCFAQFRHCEF